jgi:hypothetical protein
MVVCIPRLGNRGSHPLPSVADGERGSENGPFVESRKDSPLMPA